MPTLTEVFQAPGSFSVPFRRDPELEDLLTYFRHIQFWWNDRLVAQGPLFTIDPQPGLFVVSGALMPWWLGTTQGNEGTPDIEALLRYCGGNNKLSNHDFANDDLYWSRAEDSGWTISGGVATSGNYEGEDVLSHQDSHEVFPGDPMLFGVTATKSGPAAYLRARTVLSGRFTHPNLITNPGFESGAAGWTEDDDTEIVTDANARSGSNVLRLDPVPKANLLPAFASWSLDSDVSLVDGVVVMGPVTKPTVIADASAQTSWDLGDLPSDTRLDWDPVETTKFGGVTIREEFLITNRSFEDGTTGWIAGSGGNVTHVTDGGAFSTTDYIRFVAAGSDVASLRFDLASSGLQPGDDVRFTVFGRSPEGCTDAAGKDVALVMALRSTEEDEDFTPTAHNDNLIVLLPRDAIGTTWQKQNKTTTISDHDTGAPFDLRIFVPDIINAGYWDFDHLSLKRMRGNVEAIGLTDQALGNYFPVEPDKRYAGRVVIESDNVRRHGHWSMEISTRNSDGSNQDVHRVAELTVSEKEDTNTLHRIDFEFTPEEGQDRARIKMFWEDVYVGGIFVHMDKLKVHVANGHRRFARVSDIPVASEAEHRFAIRGRVDESLKEGDLKLRIMYQGVEACDAVQESSAHDFRRETVDVCADAPDILYVDFTPPEGVTLVDAEIWCEDAKGGSFYIDEAELYQTSGVRRKVTQTGIPLIPGRSYPLSLYVRPDTTLTGGKFWPRVVMKPADQGDFEQGEDVVRDGPPLEIREDEDATGLWTLVEMSVAPETGYDSCDFHIMSEDVEGGSFWVDDAIMFDGDENTLVYEDRIGTSGTHTQSFTVPEGAESGSWQVAVDGPNGAGWTVDDAVFRRDCTPVPATTIVRDALVGTGLTEGTLYDAGDIAFDLVFRNLTPRQRIDEVSRAGVVQPSREWRANPDGTFDWGLPEELFVDRNVANGLVLFRENDVYLLSDPDAQSSRERFATKVRVLGAERRTTQGDPYTVTGTATNSADGMKLFDGSEFARTHLIEDGGVDHTEYADALAQDTAAGLAQDHESYEVEVSDWRTLADFDLGDWTYLEHQTEGIEDPDNPIVVDGVTVYPKKLRVPERTWRLGSGPFRIVLRRGPGDEVDVSEFVDWPSITSASLVLGDPRPEFLSNPQGGATGAQYLKRLQFLASK